MYGYAHDHAHMFGVQGSMSGVFFVTLHIEPGAHQLAGIQHTVENNSLQHYFGFPSL